MGVADVELDAVVDTEGGTSVGPEGRETSVLTPGS